MKCAICHKIIRYIGIIYLSKCDIWHMLCVKKLHTAIKSVAVSASHTVGGKARASSYATGLLST